MHDSKDFLKSSLSLSKARQNPWILATFILAIVLLFLIFTKSSSFSSDIVGKDAAANNLLSFIKGQGSNIQLVSSEQNGSFYQVVVNYQGQDIIVYLTLDGKYLVPQLIPLVVSNRSASMVSDSDNQERVEVSVDNDAVIGSANASVTIVEFSDYQCPYCRKFWTETYPSLKKNYIDNGKVKLIFRDFPLGIHPSAQISAEAAECVREKGGNSAYWKMHDKIFSEQNIIDSGSFLGPVKGTVEYGKVELVKWAKAVGYDITSCLDSGKYTAEVKKDLSDGESYGITGTPAFFINGIRLSGAYPYSTFKDIIDSELEEAD